MAQIRQSWLQRCSIVSDTPALEVAMCPEMEGTGRSHLTSTRGLPWIIRDAGPGLGEENVIFSRSCNTGQFDKKNRAIKDPPQNRHRNNGYERIGNRLASVLDAGKFAQRLKTPGGLRTKGNIRATRTSEPDRSIADPTRQISGRNTRGYPEAAKRSITVIWSKWTWATIAASASSCR